VALLAIATGVNKDALIKAVSPISKPRRRVMDDPFS